MSLNNHCLFKVLRPNHDLDEIMIEFIFVNGLFILFAISFKNWFLIFSILLNPIFCRGLPYNIITYVFLKLNGPEKIMYN